MNRWDEIQATARDIASNVHSDPEKVTAMADDLIKLCGLMIGAVGKAVAVEGESNISDPDDDSAHARYLTGERIQDAARSAVAEASSPGCDLERWTRPDPTGYVHPEGIVWTYTDRRPDIRAVVREELDAAVRRQEQVFRQATENQWASDWFRREVQRLREGRPQATTDATLHVPYCHCCGGPCAHGNAVPDASQCCFPFSSVCPIHC